MNITASEWNNERERLEGTLSFIKNKLIELNSSRENIYREVKGMKKDFWSNQPIVPENMCDLKTITEITQSHQNIAHIARREVIYKNNIDKMERVLKTPYFARIDFKEDGEEEEKYYIGISTVMDNDLNIMIYDWRAPVCSMFYHNQMGRTSYKCMDGIIQGDLSFRRQYKIENEELKFMFNSSTKIDDEFLQEILSESSDDKMKSIIQSIQEEQDEAIRYDNSDMMIVQGPAGSGKTSVALHRAAYLLYKYKNNGISADNIVIFSPNDIFNDYISDVLPKLGEDNIYQTTFLQYLNETLPRRFEIEDPNDQMEFILTCDEREESRVRCESIKFKNSELIGDLIDEHVRYIETKGIKFKDLCFRDNVIVKKERLEDLFYNTYSRWPVQNRFGEIVQDVFEALKPIQKEIIQKEIKMDMERYEFDDANVVKSRVYNEFNVFKSNIKNIFSIKPLKEYKKLLRSRFKFAARGVKSDLPKDIDKIVNHTLMNLKGNDLSYEDAVVLSYMMNKLGRSKKELSGIKYVIIDEAQDYSPFQYRIFKELFPKSNFTVLGDVNQAINPLNKEDIYGSIFNQFKGKKPHKKTLLKSYRSTEEIFDLAKKVLHTKDLVNVCRKGEKPCIIKVESDEERIEKILNDIRENQKNGTNSMGIICRSMKDAERLFSVLSSRNHMDLNLLSKEESSFKSGICVVPSYLAKGLEFDRVVIAQGEDEIFNKEGERKLFYTICTRALHHLKIYSKGNITRFLKE